MTETTSLKRSLSGVVISDKANKTIVVEVKRRLKHALLGKYITASTKLHAHDEKNECEIGDSVLIQEGIPKSKKKSWYLAEIVRKATK
jgi:small subunit ribosomal protein S17|tara:strand:+ start:611 stop:874 length:264 start_codon:yes stop_codon:yes gene_type:complete